MRSSFGFMSVLVILLIILLSSTFTVNQWEQALVLRFREVHRVENVWGKPENAGLKFKWPMPVERVIFMDRRNLEVDLQPVELQAADQERLVVDAFVRYRIKDAVAFYKSLQNQFGAQQKIQSIMASTLRNVLGRVERPDIIAGRRAELMAEIEAIANDVAEKESYGIEIIDVRIKRVDLPQENAQKVFQRMVSQRQQEAARYRAEGDERAQEITAIAQKMATVIKAEAQRQAEIVRGEGDKSRNQIYAQAYELDPEFFAFYRSMKAYKRGLGQGTSYILSPESDFLTYLDDQKGQKKR